MTCILAVFGGEVGLAITQVMGLVGMCQWGMRRTAEAENLMTSVSHKIIEILCKLNAPTF